MTDSSPSTVHLWIRRGDGRFLLGAPPAEGNSSLVFAAPSARVGRSDTELITALRLSAGETGINLPADQGKCVLSLPSPPGGGTGPASVWLFEYDGAADVSGMEWLSAGEITRLAEDGKLSPSQSYFPGKIAGLQRLVPERRGFRNVEFSRTEVSRGVRYPDINGQGRLFGGRLLEWIDEIAGIASMRHAGQNVSTVSIEHLEFKRGAYANDTLVLIANVTHVGKSSIEVRVDTWIEDLDTGRREVINRAFLTEVCIDSDGHSCTCPYGLLLESESEYARWEGAEKRIAIRRQGNREGF